MRKTFNTDGYCDPNYNYMVNLSSRLEQIRGMVDAGQYFTIHRARQYGKTTILTALAEYLRKDYRVISLDFQGISSADFASEQNFVAALSRQILLAAEELPAGVQNDLIHYAEDPARAATLSVLFLSLTRLCENTEKAVVLLIDEVDSATNNQVFLDFLAQLRFYYLKRRRISTFQSVILAGVCDVRNIRRKIRPDEEHKTNSPWNIAADFDVEMSFSSEDIAGMLQEYEADVHTGMDIREMAQLLYDYTSGYPYLVSRLCKLMDERISSDSRIPGEIRAQAWTVVGFQAAMKILLEEPNPLYHSLKRKLEDYPELRKVLYDLLFTGKPVPYTSMTDYIEEAAMFGFIKNVNGTAMISNRVFETVLYNWFIAKEYAENKLYKAGFEEKNQFVAGGHLNVRRILEKFVESFDSLYGDREESFLEEVGRRYFMLFLKPIINGTGNCYVEAETRNHERTDLVIDYRGDQFVIEMKVWRGNAYNERGERQLCEYLDHYHLNKGYMLSFNFNKKKKVGVTEIVIGDRVLVEAVV
ncbi:MAG: ATP-binding protein [Lachnospiraceae bacterium]|nr:ATP-binding protein [Lachnospiraceae bacterium]